MLIADELDEAASLPARYGIGALDQEAFVPTFTTTQSLVLIRGLLAVDRDGRRTVGG